MGHLALVGGYFSCGGCNAYHPFNLYKLYGFDLFSLALTV